MDRRSHRARRQAPRRGECHPRADDARAWPPSRPGARRGGRAAAPGAAARQSRQRHLAGAARRASGQLRGGGARSRRGALSRRRARALWASCISPRSAACCRSAIRIRRSTPRSIMCSARWSTRGWRARAWRVSSCSLLSELGFGLDLESCAATGSTAELIYVSPKSGRAVSREAGRALAGQAAAPAGLSGRAEPDAGAVRGRSRRRLCDDRLLPARVTCSSRAGSPCRTRAAAS